LLPFLEVLLSFSWYETTLLLHKTPQEGSGKSIQESRGGVGKKIPISEPRGIKATKNEAKKCTYTYTVVTLLNCIKIRLAGAYGNYRSTLLAKSLHSKLDSRVTFIFSFSLTHSSPRKMPGNTSSAPFVGHFQRRVRGSRSHSLASRTLTERRGGINCLKTMLEQNFARKQSIISNYLECLLSQM